MQVGHALGMYHSFQGTQEASHTLKLQTTPAYFIHNSPQRLCGLCAAWKLVVAMRCAAWKRCDVRRGSDVMCGVEAM